MNKPDWKDAPDWANVMVQQNGFCGICYCWTEAHEDDAKAIWHEDFAINRNHMAFKLRKVCWDFAEHRP